MTSENLASQPVPSSVPTPRELLAAAHEFSQRLAERSSRIDAHRELPHSAFDEIRSLRLGLLRVPQSLGGAGGSVRDVAQLAITLATADSNTAQALLGHFVFLERLRLMGSEEQQVRYQTLAAQGVLFGAAAAERGGKFRGDMATQLLPEAGASSGSGEFVLNGTKHYSTGALFADILKIRAVDEQGRMVAAIVPASREGVRLDDDWDGMGQRCTASGTTHLHNVKVHANEILPMYQWTGRRHHTGALAQIFHCAIDTGIALAALRDSIAWAKKGIRPVRESGLERAQDDPYILRTLGTISATAQASRALVLHAAQQIDLAAQARFGDLPERAQEADELAVQASITTAEAKIISTEASLRAAQLLFDVGGAATTLRSHNYDRHWRNARTHTTHDPVAYKYRAVGNYRLNDAKPPLTFSY